MSSSVFPSLPGLAFGITRTPLFNTLTKRSASGIDFRAALQQYPLYEFVLNYEFLKSLQAQELQTLIGFFLSMGGQFDSFLYVDPLDNTVAGAQFGIGDGSTTGFQLTRPFGAGGFTFAEPVQNLQPVSPTEVDIAGSPTTDYIVDENGFLTFGTAPGAGFPLTWSGSFYYRCRFGTDSLDPTLFAQGLHSLSKVKFVGAPGNRV